MSGGGLWRPALLTDKEVPPGRLSTAARIARIIGHKTLAHALRAPFWCRSCQANKHLRYDERSAGLKRCARKICTHELHACVLYLVQRRRGHALVLMIDGAPMRWRSVFVALLVRP